MIAVVRWYLSAFHAGRKVWCSQFIILLIISSSVGSDLFVGSPEQFPIHISQSENSTSTPWMLRQLVTISISHVTKQHWHLSKIVGSVHYWRRDSRRNRFPQLSMTKYYIIVRWLKGNIACYSLIKLLWLSPRQHIFLVSMFYRHVSPWWRGYFNLQGSVAKKPYNPILGETFRCFWVLPECETSRTEVSDVIMHTCYQCIRCKRSERGNENS